MQQLVSSMIQDPRHLLHLLLRERGVALIDGVADAGEESLVVAGPGLWGEDDVLKLVTARELL